MSKSKSKGSKGAAPAETSVLNKVKDAAIVKPAQTIKAKSKEVAKQVAAKEEKKPKSKKVKEPTPEPSESEDSESESEESDSSSEEEEIKKPALNGKANGKVNGKSTVAPAKDDDSEDDSDEASDASESSDDEAPTNGAVSKGAALKKAPAASDDDSDDDSESDSSDIEVPAAKTGKAAKSSDESEEEESDEDSDEEVAPAKSKGSAKAKAVSKKAGPVASDDSEVESNEDSDESASDSDVDSSDESSEEEVQSKPVASKRKAEDTDAPAAKKSKTTTANGETGQGGNLFVGNLSWNVDEEWLTREFEEYGELSGVRLITDRATGRSKGFGYVEFVNAADAAKAHEAKKGAMIDGRSCNVDFANGRSTGTQPDRAQARAKSYGDSTSQPSDTLFVGNLSFEVGQETVSDAFGEYGTILGVRLPTDRETGEPKGFGYVTFSSVDEAKAALDNMQGADIAGRACRLDYSQPRPQNGDSPGRGGRGGSRGGFGGGFGGRGGRGGGRGRGGFGDRGGRGGRGGSTNRGGFGDFSGKKVTF